MSDDHSADHLLEFFSDGEPDELDLRQNYLPNIHDKINEAAYFLGRMDDCVYVDEFRWLTSAFLGAIRSCLDCFGWEAHSEIDPFTGEEGLRTTTKEVLAKYMRVDPPKRGKIFVTPLHPELILMADLRLVTAHRGPLRIHSSKQPPQAPGERLNESFCFPSRHTPHLSSDSEYRVLPLCKRWLALIRRIQAELDPTYDEHPEE